MLAGRRLAGRLLPYGSEAGGGPRFDPVERRFLRPPAEPAVHAGPFREEAWSEALARVPAGPRSRRAAVAGRARLGGLSGGRRCGVVGRAARSTCSIRIRPRFPRLPAASAVALCSWKPGRPAAAFPGLAAARGAGLAAAALFPLLPGWTAEDEALEALADAAARGGAAALCALVPFADGEGRRAIVEARAGVEPEAADRFFEVIHHGDWPDRLASRLAAARAAAQRRGLAALPPRPAGRGQPAGQRGGRGGPRGAGGARRSGRASGGAPLRRRPLDRRVRAGPRGGGARGELFERIFPFGGEIAEAAASRGAAGRTMTAGIYVHLPYCASRCGYCAFVVSTDGSTRDAYLAALDAEAALAAEEAPGAPRSTRSISAAGRRRSCRSTRWRGSSRGCAGGSRSSPGPRSRSKPTRRT